MREKQCWGIGIDIGNYEGVSWDMGMYVEGRTHSQFMKEPYLRERIINEER
ncbi:MAG: hypothetical protein HY517_00040 [Candidatus Aenigmarchaeota archaeon]|nr:hypothetical protein [Candidatus Aenigmarchaeota archaeon]